MRALAAVMTSMACWAGAGSALASPESVTYSLGWTRMPGAETCVGAGALARTVEARLGHPAWAPTSAADVLIEGFIEKRRDKTGWHAHIVLSDPNGTVLGVRDVENDEIACETLDPSVTLVLALVIDPHLLFSPAPAQTRAPSELAPASAPSPEPAPKPAVGPNPATNVASARGGEVSLGAAIAGGILPGIATGLAVTEAIGAGAWTFELGGTVWLPRDAELTSNQLATLSLVEAQARACPIGRRTADFFVRGCAGAAAGLLVAHGFGFDTPHATKRPTFSFELTGDGALRLSGPVWLGARLSGIVPVIREHFVYVRRDGQNVELFRMNAVGGALEVWVGMHFGS